MLLLVLWCASALAFAAQVAGTVINLNGPLMAKRANGSVKALAVRSEVEEGDLLVTEKGTYARIKFIDDSEITLKPGTMFKVESFAFQAGNPEKDSATFSLVKGGLRSVTGLLGKRNKERFLLRTPVATIGIRGTTFIAELVDESEQSLAAMNDNLFASSASLVPLQVAQSGLPGAPGVAKLTPGLYVHVLDGMIFMSNSGGGMQFNAGQFGFTPNFKLPPILLPVDPGIKFHLPPAFNLPSSSNGSNASNLNTVDCEVR